jgi:hypothetical protein
MRHRLLALGLVAVTALGAAGCSVGNGNEEDLVPTDRPTPETTPFLEPASPNPATDVERPDVEPENEDAEPPEDNDLGTDDGEQ